MPPPSQGQAPSGGEFQQCYDAQAAVAADRLLMVAPDVVQGPNDKQQLEPMLGVIVELLPAELGKIGELLADNGYFSEGNVNACAAAGIEPVIATERVAHHLALGKRFAYDPPAPGNPTPVGAMRHRLETKRYLRSKPDKSCTTDIFKPRVLTYRAPARDKPECFTTLRAPFRDIAGETHLKAMRPLASMMDF